MAALKKIALDARELEHPKPLELAIQALKSMDEESYFYMIHRKKPIPLIDLATEQHFQIFHHEDSKGNWHILIAKSDHINLSEFLEDHV